MMGVFRDLYKTYLNFIYGPNHEAFTGNLKGTFEEARAEYAEKFKPFLNKLSSFIGEKNYYCGDITYVDFVIAEFIQQLNEMDPSLFENENKNVLNHQKRIWELPAIKSYL